ncbi:MAG: amidohydrolase [Pegethrix bostrychoides GSE-TBD4-15B]|uniref:Amidohydrolase n=1 Tax=Pegethrix bostrychoides GSE-TBD4-15B TaxID=2839662 RepID=A0A951P9H0_9CYAN|nr:amidohydrolase [Pegethrix bostrychoides GSE-TBD4-15B]
MSKHQQRLESCPCCNPAMHLLAQTFISRRQFMLLGTGAFAATLALSRQSNAVPALTVSQADTTADTIYINADVVTANDAQPTAEAVAIKAGRILAVGDRATVEQFKGNATQIFDLQGRTMMPGFIDPHGHVFQQGLAAVVADLLPPPDGPIDDIAKLQAALRTWGSQPAAAELGWIIGNGYDDAMLQEQRHPTRADLDAVSTEQPILIIHQSGHLGVLNSKGLEKVGITATTSNPQGGVIRRQADSNEPDGVLEENAFYLALSTVAKTAQVSPEAPLNLIRRGTEIYARYGFTTAQEGRAIKGVYEAIRAAAAQAPLPIDVAVYVDYAAHPDAHTWGVSQTYTNRVRLAGVKMTFDGSPQGRTAWLSQPYYQVPEGQPADYLGYGVYTEEQAINLVDSAYQHNVQSINHCNGDAAIDQFIMAVRKATEKHGKGDRRTTLIHGQTVREDQLDAMKELGMFPALFPAHVFYWGDWHREVTLGPERAARISPMRSALDRGMKATIHTDSPVVLPHPTRTMWSAVNRRTRSDFVLGADQRLTPLEALKALTIWAAYQHFEEDQKGSIEVGKLADFAILSDNPLTVDPTTIRDIEVLETIKEGETVYKR